jgi:acrylyl-CoA reductase (NADPH)
MQEQDYEALIVRKTEQGTFSQALEQRSTADLPAGELLVRVRWSSLNFKDMLSANGHPGVTRRFPHQPGIDAAGEVVHSDDPAFAAGDEVIVSGYDLGMGTPGGLGQYIRVPARWAIGLPAGLSARESMIYGTAGFTAALCIEKIEQMGAAPGQGLVAVTGASGGVGSFAVALLAKRGYEVAAVTGKADERERLLGLGAREIVARSELLGENGTALAMRKPRFAHAVDAVGGEYLASLLNAVAYQGSVACCGLAASPALNTSVMPFILRGVNLLGVDCVELPLTRKQATWQRIAGEMKLATLDAMAAEISLSQVPEHLALIAQGQASGRYLVRL